MLAVAPYAHNDVLSTVFSAASLARPHWRPPSGWTEHGPFAFWLIQAIRPSSFVELGTHYGYSFFSVCQAVEEFGLNTKCVAIDTWSGDEHAGHYGSEVLQAARREVRRYEAFATLRQSTFDAALAEFEDRSIDLLHIDGRHRYEDACRDWSTWLPKVSKCGVVLFHDTQVRKQDFGVYRLWAEVCHRYPSFEFHHGNGLGILGVGEELPRSIDGLFQAGRDEKAAVMIRDLYQRLGASLGDPHFQVQRKKNLAASVRRRIVRLASMLRRA